MDLKDTLARIDWGQIDLEQRRELLNLLEEYNAAKSSNRLADYKPYPKQLEFHAAGALPGVRELALVAANQVGKTYSAAAETAMHLTGRYPLDWPGRRWVSPVSGWAGSNTGLGTRDTVQRLLMGRPGEWGTGQIPKECIVEAKRAAHGVADALDTVIVRHVGGGRSTLAFKSYDQGRERWQGETLDFVWFDEEPPEDIYFEGLTRTNATGGRVYMTFTPLLGMSKVVKRFLKEKPPGTYVVRMTIEDAGHYTAEQRAAISASYKEHEREARVRGNPVLGSGAVYSVTREGISTPAFVLPHYWPRICGIDFGWDHPFAAAWLAWDRDTDTVYLYDTFKQREATPAAHVMTLRAKGPWIPIAWPHDGMQHEKGTGETLAHIYKRHGANMLAENATFQEGGNSVEAGVTQLLERMQTGRFKVFAHLDDFWEELELYHRKDGRIVKEDDDLLDGIRYGIMSLRYSKTQDTSTTMPKVDAFGLYDSVAGY